MSFRDWLGNTSERIRKDGVAGLGESLYPLYRGSWRIVGSRLPLGTNVYDRDWDVLVVLDACRVDLAQEVANEYPALGTVGSMRSVASTSREWLAKTFASDRRASVERTAYVTANPYTDDILSPDATPKTRSPFNPANWSTVTSDDFAYLDEVWTDGWDDDLGTVPPRTVTDRAIHAAREHDHDRLIVHYMQPHQPFIGDIEDGKTRPAWRKGNCWDTLRRGEVTREELWMAYRRNLEYVLDEMELLCSNVDADTVAITADHGNGLGEWGVYGHPNGCLQPTVKRVPWIETSAEDTGERDPSITQEATDSTVSDRLESLGYL